MEAPWPYLLKGGLGILGLLLLLWHMFTTPGPMSVARALRYVALMTAAGAVGFVSQTQLRVLPPWGPPQWSGLVIALAVIVAAIASLMEDRGITLRRRRKP